MIDYGSMEKFEAKIGFVEQDIYLSPIFDKFHKELYQIADLVDTADVYTTKTSACYVGSGYVSVNSPLFTYPVIPFVPDNEQQVVTEIESACEALVTQKLVDVYSYPPNYVFIINFINLSINEADEITDIRIRYAFHKVDDQPWPQP